jgi:hypothetical protein
MLRIQKVRIADIYVPTARRKLLHPETVRALAEDIVENGLKMPIQVRQDDKRRPAPAGGDEVARRGGDRRLPRPGQAALNRFPGAPRQGAEIWQYLRRGKNFAGRCRFSPGTAVLETIATFNPMRGQRR